MGFPSPGESRGHKFRDTNYKGLLQNVSFAAVLFCLPWQFSVASKGYMNSLCFIWSIAKLTGKRLTVWLWIISECYSL